MNRWRRSKPMPTSTALDAVLNAAKLVAPLADLATHAQEIRSLEARLAQRRADIEDMERMTELKAAKLGEVSGELHAERARADQIRTDLKTQHDDLIRTLSAERAGLQQDITALRHALTAETQRRVQIVDEGLQAAIADRRVTLAELEATITT